MIIMFPNVVFVMFLAIRVHWASWIYGFIVLIKFGHFLTIVSLNIFYVHHLSSPLDTSITELGHLRFPTAEWCAVHLILLVFPLCVSLWIISVAMFSSSLIFPSALSNLSLVSSSVFFTPLSSSFLEVWFRSFSYLPCVSPTCSFFYSFEALF